MSILINATVINIFLINFDVSAMTVLVFPQDSKSLIHHQAINVPTGGVLAFLMDHT
jgi:hypothetical protein